MTLRIDNNVKSYFCKKYDKNAFIKSVTGIPTYMKDIVSIINLISKTNCVLITNVQFNHLQGKSRLQNCHDIKYNMVKIHIF